MSNLTFKRGQIEWALWRSFRPIGAQDDGPPQVFKTRIKRLLDLDRAFDVRELGPQSIASLAFTKTFEGGSGIEAAYTGEDVFALALALDLLDVGFKQGEIVFVVRHLREIIDDWFLDLVKRPDLMDRQRLLASRYPELPSFDPGSGKAALADARVFLLLNRIEITEVLSVTSKTKRGQAVFLEPEVCEGLKALQLRLQDLMPVKRRALVLIEMAGLAQSVHRFLQEAPIAPRGRPRRQA